MPRLTEHTREGDLLDSRPFADAIAFGGWPIDTHPPEGVNVPELPPCEQRHLPCVYDLPLREIVLIFDTGLHRLLMLSQADGSMGRMLRGRPQPETARDYSIAVETADGWREIERVQGNYQRRREHRLASILEVVALRLTLSATNGITHARIAEVRAY